MGLGITSAIAPIVGDVANSILGITKRKNQEQLEQQGQLQELQIKGAKEMADYNSNKAYDMWQKTGVVGQTEQMKKAGLNPALMYGQGGAGGATTNAGGGTMPSGGTATDPTASRQADMGIAMMSAQLGLIKAQTTKTEAEAAKTAGVDTESTRQSAAESKSRQVGIDFQNAINNTVGIKSEADAKRAQNDIQSIQSEKQNLEWETFKREGWQSGSVEDSNNLANRAIKAGLQQTITTLENAKKDGAIKSATIAIEQFKAGLAKQGISPDSPWYIKILGDLLDKVGLSPIKAAKNIMQ